MDFLRQQLNTINERLAGLTATQKMLTAALAVIVVMTLLYYGKGASTTDMVPVLPGVVNGEALADVTKALSSRGIAFQTNSSGQIVVASAKQEEALAAISFSSETDISSSTLFTNMLDRSSPLDTNGKWDAQLNNYNEQKLARVIAWGPGIKSAEVSIRDASRGLGLVRKPPTAHVAIRLKDDNTVPRRRIAEGAANAVATSIGVDRSSVGVTIDGIVVNLADPNKGGAGVDSGEIVQQKRVWEEHYIEKIRKQFSDIEGLNVDVTVALDTETAEIMKHDVDPTKKISMPVQTSGEKSTSTEASQATADPGVVSNIPVSVNTPRSGTPLAGSSTERNDETNQVDYGRSESKIFKPSGNAHAESAALRVPLNYFTALWARQNPNAGPAQGTAFDTFVSAELDRMRDVVKQITRVAEDKQVVATVGPAMATPDELKAVGGPMLAAADTTGGSLKLFAAGHAKDVAVGLLALASLFMVSRMVKKSAPAMPEAAMALDNDSTPLATRMAATSGAVVAKVRGASGPKTLKGSDDIAGDVIESGPVMMGQELDAEVLETSQMVDQVGDFVKDNPDVAAQLLNRWLNRE